MFSKNKKNGKSEKSPRIRKWSFLSSFCFVFIFGFPGLGAAAECLHMTMMRVARSNERCSSKEISSFFKSLRLVSKGGGGGSWGPELEQSTRSCLFSLRDITLVCSLAPHYSILGLLVPYTATITTTGLFPTIPGILFRETHAPGGEKKKSMKDESTSRHLAAIVS